MAVSLQPSDLIANHHALVALKIAATLETTASEAPPVSMTLGGDAATEQTRKRSRASRIQLVSECLLLRVEVVR